MTGDQIERERQAEREAILLALRPHLDRLRLSMDGARERWKISPRSHTRRAEFMRCRGEVVGLLIALSVIDGGYGEGHVQTARRYGMPEGVYP